MIFDLMKISLKLASVAAVTLTVAVALSGCSSAPVEEVYTPPGLELGDKIVAPPAELPAATAAAGEQEVVEDTVTCDMPTALDDKVISVLNKPPSTVLRTDASLNGEIIVSGEEIPVETIYPKSFSHLLKIHLDSGETVWFGSSGSLSDQATLNEVRLDPSGEASVFGATKSTYDHFVWGSSAGPESAIVAEGEKVVAKYGDCF